FALYRLKTDINYATNRNCVLELGVKQWITSILISSCKKITEFHGFRYYRETRTISGFWFLYAG
ncbi:MAG: hypothetical protein IJN64_15740, partial [Lachnospiraceae bacterium]|nr:hypothetical protein [Lachnospiraceae bacterium]